MAQIAEKTKTIHLHGRRWFQRSYGNTYNTCQIWVNGKEVHKTPEQYGYGDHWMQLATEWLKENDYLPGFDSGHLRIHCEENNIELVKEVDDVSRERDL